MLSSSWHRAVLMASKLMCVLTLLAASVAWPHSAHSDEQDGFWSSLEALCGQAFAGELTVYDSESDAGWVGQPMKIHFRECLPNQIKVPLVVGDNRSRTWVITRSNHGLALKHDHRHEDGSEDAVTWYGGKTTDAGRPWRQAFAVDDYSKALFFAEGLDVSAQNIWYMELHPGEKFAYGLTRPNRHFRAEFDLSHAIDPPPAPWGAE